MKRQHIDKVVNLAKSNSPLGERRLQRQFYNQDSISLAKSLLGKVILRRLSTGQVLRGTIVETEAYPGSQEAKDLNVHCFITKRTDKNGGIFMEAGTTWVYMTYGVFNMINISSELPGSACLLRAIEPIGEDDLELMEKFRIYKKPKKVTPAPALTNTSRSTRRSKVGNETAAEPLEVEPTPDVQDISVLSTTFKSKFKPHELGNGPGKLCKVLNIEKSTCDQLDLTTSPDLWIEPNDAETFVDGNFQIVSAPRIGIGSAPQSSQEDRFRFYILNNLSVSTAKVSEIKKNVAQAESPVISE